MIKRSGAGPYLCASVSEPLPFIRVMYVNTYRSMDCNLYGSNFGKQFLLQKKIPILQLISKS